MKTHQLIVLLMVVFFAASQNGCGKSSDEKLAEKKTKELHKGEFNNPPAKSY